MSHKEDSNKDNVKFPYDYQIYYRERKIPNLFVVCKKLSFPSMISD